jgi:hypothetical protein
MTVVPPAVFGRASFRAGGPHGGFRLAVFFGPPVIRAALLGLIIGVIKTAFIIEDNIIGRAVIGIYHRLRNLRERKEEGHTPGCAI